MTDGELVTWLEPFQATADGNAAFGVGFYVAFALLFWGVMTLNVLVKWYQDAPRSHFVMMGAMFLIPLPVLAFGTSLPTGGDPFVVTGSVLGCDDIGHAQSRLVLDVSEGRYLMADGTSRAFDGAKAHLGMFTDQCEAFAPGSTQTFIAAWDGDAAGTLQEGQPVELTR